MTQDELQAEVTRLGNELATLTANSNKLVKEKRDALSRAEAAEQARDDALENANSANSSELEKATRRADKAERELQNSIDRATKLEQNYRNQRADSLLTSAMAAANIDTKAMPFLMKGMKTDIEFADDDTPMIQGQTIADYIKEFTAPQGDGHHFVRAPNNSGGAASGYVGGGSNGQKQWSAAPKSTAEWNEFEALPQADQKAIAERLGFQL